MQINTYIPVRSHEEISNRKALGEAVIKGRGKGKTIGGVRKRRSGGKPKIKSYGGAGADIFSEENPFSGVNFG